MRHIGMSWLIAIVLAGCISNNPPSVYAFGSYFPSWLLCAVIGIIGAVLVRLAFIRLGLDDELPFRLFIYVCVALIIAIATSLLFFST